MSKAKTYLTRGDLVHIQEFNKQGYISYLKKTGGQVFQFYSLTRNRRYELSDYVETEVVFSREIFRRSLYTSHIYPLTLQDSFTSTATLAGGDSTYFGERLLPKLSEASRATAKLSYMTIRDVLRRGYSPAEKISIKAQMTALEARPAYVSRRLVESMKTKARLKTLTSKWGILEVRGQMPEESRRIRATATPWGISRSSKREFSRAEFIFKSLGDITTSPAIHHVIEGKTGASIDKTTGSFVISRNRTALKLFARNNSLSDTDLQAYSLKFKVKPKGLKGSSVLAVGMIQSVRLSPDEVVVRFYSHPEKRYSLQSELGEQISLELRKGLEGNTELLVDGHAYDLGYRIPLGISEGSAIVIGNDSNLRSATLGEYSDMSINVGNPEFFGSPDAVIGSQLSIVNGELQDPYNSWELVPGVTLGDDHLNFSGGSLRPAYVEDMVIHPYNNYRVKIEFSVASAPPADSVMVLMEDRESTYRGTVQPIGLYIHKGSSSEEVKISLNLQGVTFYIPSAIALRERTKLEIVKFKRSVYIFLNDVLDDVITHPRTYLEPVNSRIVIGSSISNLAAFYGKIYGWLFENYYAGDERLVDNIISKNEAIFDYAEGKFEDQANPDNKWRLVGMQPREERGGLALPNQSIRLYLDSKVTNFGTGDFTLEWESFGGWYVNVLVGGFPGGGYIYGVDDINLHLNNHTYNLGRSSAAEDLNNLVTKTLCRKDGVIYTYVNGILVNTTESFKDVQFNMPDFYLAGQPYSNVYPVLRRVRIIKGEALYHTRPVYHIHGFRTYGAESSGYDAWLKGTWHLVNDRFIYRRTNSPIVGVPKPLPQDILYHISTGPGIAEGKHYLKEEFIDSRFYPESLTTAHQDLAGNINLPPNSTLELRGAGVLTVNAEEFQVYPESVWSVLHSPKGVVVLKDSVKVHQAESLTALSTNLTSKVYSVVESGGSYLPNMWRDSHYTKYALKRTRSSDVKSILLRVGDKAYRGRSSSEAIKIYNGWNYFRPNRGLFCWSSSALMQVEVEDDYYGYTGSEFEGFSRSRLDALTSYIFHFVNTPEKFVKVYRPYENHPLLSKTDLYSKGYLSNPEITESTTYSRILQGSPLVHTYLGEEDKPLGLSPNNPLERWSHEVTKFDHLKAISGEFRRAELLLELYFLPKSTNSAPFVAITDSSFNLALQIVDGFLAVKFREDLVQLPYKPALNSYCHIRVTVSDSLIVYINGVEIFAEATSAIDPGEFSLEFNSADAEANSHFLFDSFRLTQRIEEFSQSPLEALKNIHGTLPMHSLLDMSKMFAINLGEVIIDLSEYYETKGYPFYIEWTNRESREHQASIELLSDTGEVLQSVVADVVPGTPRPSMSIYPEQEYKKLLIKIPPTSADIIAHLVEPWMYIAQPYVDQDAVADRALQEHNIVAVFDGESLKLTDKPYASTDITARYQKSPKRDRFLEGKEMQVIEAATKSLSIGSDTYPLAGVQEVSAARFNGQTYVAATLSQTFVFVPEEVPYKLPQKLTGFFLRAFRDDLLLLYLMDSQLSVRKLSDGFESVSTYDIGSKPESIANVSLSEDGQSLYVMLVLAEERDGYRFTEISATPSEFQLEVKEDG